MGFMIILSILLLLGILLEGYISFQALTMFKTSFFWFLMVGKVCSLLLILIINKNSRSLNKDLPWIVIILLFPLMGSILYILIGSDVIKSKQLKAISKSIRNNQANWFKLSSISEITKETNPSITYLSKGSGFPITRGDQVHYYKDGQTFFEACKKELTSAKKFILLEFFTIEIGTLWEGILEILMKKVKEGVEVKLIYDNTACMKKLPMKYYKKLETLGIECLPFEKNHPLLGMIKNHRDHHKCVIVDGKVAFTGGMNIEDRYVNLEQPYGYWKDVGISIEGNSAWTFTVMFFSMWQALGQEKVDLTSYQSAISNHSQSTGIVIPFGDNPLDQETIGKNTYISMIHQAKKSLTIFTPYLILDMDLYQTLVIAAKRGVDIKIILPGIPDKKSVYQVSLANAKKLIQEKIKVYTYTKGFMHGKVLLVDEVKAIVGTINTDYRSLYFDFEYGCFLQAVPAIQEIKKDIEETLHQSKEFMPSKINFFQFLLEAFFQLFSPLM